LRKKKKKKKKPSIFYPYRYTVLLKSVSDSLAT
jgi:hypothetical protein